MADDNGVYDESPGPTSFVYGARGATKHRTKAVDLQFIDDGRALTLIEESPGFSVQLLSVSDGSASLVLRETTLSAGRIAVDGSGRWSVAAFDPNRRSENSGAIRLSGHVGNPLVQRTRFAFPERTFAIDYPPAADVVLARRYDYASGVNSLFMLRNLLGGRSMAPRTWLSAVSHERHWPLITTRLRTECAPDLRDPYRVVCAADLDDRDELWEVDLRTRRYRPLGSVPVGVADMALRGNTALFGSGGRVLYARLDQRRVWRLATGLEQQCWRESALTETHVVVLDACRSGSTLRFLQPPAP